MFASNSYLGLTGEPRVCHAASDATLRFGAGSGGARFTTESLQLYDELEKTLSDFKGTEATLLLNTGYMANVGILSVLKLNRKYPVISRIKCTFAQKF